MARPSSYTPELANEICERLLSGRSLRAICREDEDMPSASSIFLWLSKYREFAEQYARAKEAMAEAVFWDTFDISDDGRNDTYIDDKGQIRTNYDAIARSRLRVDTRKWALARMAPKKYGDRITQEIKGPVPEIRKMSPAEIAAKLETIYANCMRRKAEAEAKAAAEAEHQNNIDSDDCDFV